MPMNADGTGTCDRCGRHLPNTGVAYCVIASCMTTDGYAWVGYICTMTPDPCVDAVFTPDDLAYTVANKGMPDWYKEAWEG